MLYYLNSFYLYSILGYLLELFTKTFIFKHMNSGILYGPYLPIYGLGSIIIILIEKIIFQKLKLPRILKIILTFILVSITLSIVEYIGGLLIEIIFHKTFWNYSYMKYNIGKYASIEMSLVWGLFSLLIIYIIEPLSTKFIKKIPIPVTVLVSVVFIIDIFLTLVFH